MTALPTAVMALDQGTTSSRAIVFSHNGTVLGSAQFPLRQHYPRLGWVEHDPEDIWDTQLRSARLALARAGLEARDLSAIGIANQRETVVLWDAETGSCLGNAIVWQCRRTANRCVELRQAGLESTIEERTGLRLDPYFSASKIEWLLNNHPDSARLLTERRLRAGTVDSFLVWRLTGGRRHVTDYSNAARTMLLDLKSLHWADELLNLFGVPLSILPELCPSSAVVGTTEPSWLGSAVPIAGIAGDQQAALFGQGALRQGGLKNTYGTGCFMLMNVGSQPVRSRHGLLSTVAWALDSPTEALDAEDAPARNRRRPSPTYALEGSVFMAGGAVQWLRDALGIISDSTEIGPLAARAVNNAGVYFVPALTGLGAPYWDPCARGLLIGLTRGTRREHMARATEEAICLQTRAVLDAMRADSGIEMTVLRVDGGAATDDFLLQLQADLLGIPVIRPRTHEITALGAAALAGLATGFWTEKDVLDLAGSEKIFEPTMSPDERERLYVEWQRAVRRALRWVHDGCTNQDCPL